MTEKFFNVPDGALPDQFCIDHTVTVENPEGTDCTASLAEGWIYKCGYVTPEEAEAGCPNYRPRDYGPDADFGTSKIFEKNK